MTAELLERYEAKALYHSQRPRISRILAEAVNYPLVLVCAGAGYGKTSAVADFVASRELRNIWLQFSILDNSPARFWESLVHSIAPSNHALAEALVELGFPGSEQKLRKLYALVAELSLPEPALLVLDDFHLLENEEVLAFCNKIGNILDRATVIIITRAMPNLNLLGEMMRNRVFTISEEDLRFTDQELSQLFREQNLSLSRQTLHEIMQDTAGWAFALNLLARSYQKAPGYEGYLRSALKNSIFTLMEHEVWEGISADLRTFMLKLSLIDHLSVDLLLLLAEGDTELFAEFGKQNAYLRLDTYTNSFIIHHLFLEFLRTKSTSLSEEERNHTYLLAGEWCSQNGFRIDALSYFEKIAAYDKIVALYMELPAQVPYEIARFALGIFERALAEVYQQVGLLAVMHVRNLMCLGQMEAAQQLVSQYEAQYLAQPLSTERDHSLGWLYYSWGVLRQLNSTSDDSCDFDLYFAKQAECFTRSPLDPGILAVYPVGPWVNLVGSAQKEVTERYIAALQRSVPLVSACFTGAMGGMDEVAAGELSFHQGDLRSSEAQLRHGVEIARETQQYEVIQRALFYLMRLAFAQGDYNGVEEHREALSALTDINEYSARFTTYDIALAWLYCAVGVPEQVPDSIREGFTPCAHPSFIENYVNYAKARYRYLIRNTPTLLAFFEEKHKRETILYGRIELLAMEACVRYRMKQKQQAFGLLHRAYTEAAPNGIVMPFIELGKDMRTLTQAMLKEKEGRSGAPAAWLEEINRKSASYAKRQAHLATQYKQANRIEEGNPFSPREQEVLRDLSHGLSRSEIASSRNLSVNTVKMIINIIYAKMDAVNLPDLIRIATERKLI